MSKQIYSMSKPAIEYLCSMIKRLTKVSEAIDDINIRTDGTFSSVKINTLLNTLKQDCNDYTDRLVANLSRLELKLVTDEADITESNIMYLYKPDGATSYSQYVIIDGNKVLLGTCDIDMTDYYTITQADDKFVLKTDFDVLITSFNNLVTSVDKKIDKDKITTVLDDTVTDEQVASALLTKTELDKVNALHKTTTGYITGSLLGSVVKDANLYYQKFGDNRLVINGWVSVDAVSTRTPIFTLPNNWKANSTYLLPCYVVNSNVACACVIDVENGTVNSYTPLPATLELRFCGEIYLM